MEYAKLAGLYSRLEGTGSKLEKAGMIAEALRGCGDRELPIVTRLVQGRVFPAWSEREIGIASQLMIKAISSSTGFPEGEVQGEFNRSGDLGLVAEKLVSGKRQSTLFRGDLTVEKVFRNLRGLSGVEGKGSQQRKFRLVSEMLSPASPLEARYIVRTVLGTLRVGVAAGIVRDSIAKAFLGDEDPKEAVEAVEWAWFLRPDYGEVAVIAKERGIKGLREVELEVGKPYMVQLSERAGGLDEALGAFESPALEFKYDGARVCMHRDGDRLWIFTRRLEDVTEQFPEVRDMVKKAVKAKQAILEGEMVGISRDTGRPLPFQALSQRIKRKYGIREVMEEIPVVVNLFDVTLLEGETLFRKPLRERWKALGSLVRPLKGFGLAEHAETRDMKEAGRFYERSLRSGHEGLIVKNLDSSYQPGRRVAGGWLKVKPVMENLDLVIIGAAWGTGKRAGWLGSLVLGVRDPEGGGFLECGMLGTGIKEKGEQGGVTFAELTRLLRPHIESEKGNRVKLKPRVVVEVSYEEIQKSPNYSSGYALRFPRIASLRTADKGPEQADTLERLKELYRKQGK